MLGKHQIRTCQYQLENVSCKYNVRYKRAVDHHKNQATNIRQYRKQRF